MKLARDQRFYWTETREFTRAKLAMAPAPNRWLSAALLSLLFAMPLALVGLPEDSTELAVLAGFAISAALLVAFVLLPVCSRIPTSILVGSNRLVVGQEVIWFKNVAHAIVGTTPIGGQSFPVLSIQTKEGRSYLLGLSTKVDSQALQQYLEQAGLREPHA